MDTFYGFSTEKKYLFENFKKKSLSNSIILYGQKGIGKKTFIDHLLIEFFNFNFNGKNINHHINLIKKFTHPNIRYVKREFDDKLKKYKKNITIGQIRSLNNFFHESAIDGMNKFIIIDSKIKKNSAKAIY